MAKKIMVVDDNPDVRYTVVRGISALTDAYEFVQVEDGNQCIEMLEKGANPDLILLDIMMPELDGWEVAARVKSDDRFKQIPIIFLTAKTDEMSKGMGSLSASDYICKPFEVEDLKSKVDEILK
jgi:CheY-like chemotaxis protein